MSTQRGFQARTRQDSHKLISSKMETRMKKILTLFTAFAVAFVFAFLISASPPTVAAERPNVEKFSVEKTKTVQICSFRNNTGLDNKISINPAKNQKTFYEARTLY